jgi:hypothetical protein
VEPGDGRRRAARAGGSGETREEERCRAQEAGGATLHAQISGQVRAEVREGSDAEVRQESDAKVRQESDAKVRQEGDAKVRQESDAKTGASIRDASSLRRD